MDVGNEIKYTKQYFEQNGIQDISFNYSTNDYRNRQVILSDKVYASIDYTENILANGYNREFMTASPIGEIKSITVNGVQATFGYTSDKDIGLDYDFYYTIQQYIIQTIYFH